MLNREQLPCRQMQPKGSRDILHFTCKIANTTIYFLTYLDTTMHAIKFAHSMSLHTRNTQPAAVPVADTTKVPEKGIERENCDEAVNPETINSQVFPFLCMSL